MAMKWLEAIALILLFKSFTLRSAQASYAVSWNYTDQEAWESVGIWECDGTRQSPINIDTDDVVTNDTLIDLTVTNLDQEFNGNFSNNGHSVRFDPDVDLATLVLQNHLGTYEMQQFHFHWGPTSTLGSEHTINGQTYGGELHFVTRKTTGSSTDGDAYAVLGVLLVSDSSLSATGSWLELQNNIPTAYDEINSVSGLILTDLMPTDLSYYHYEGSLTTPACSEVVQWFLLKNSVSVPSTFLDALRTTVNDEDGEILDTNYRQTQQLNDRQVMIQAEGSSSDNTPCGLSGGLLVCVAISMTIFDY